MSLTTRQEQKALAKGRAIDTKYKHVRKPRVGEIVCYVGRYGTDGSPESLRAEIVKLGPGPRRVKVRWASKPPRNQSVVIENLRYPPK